MNSFHEKTSTPVWLSPCAGQASAGTVACAAAMVDGQVEPGQPEPPYRLGAGRRRRRRSRTKRQPFRQAMQRSASRSYLPPKFCCVRHRPCSSAMLPERAVGCKYESLYFGLWRARGGFSRDTRGDIAVRGWSAPRIRRWPPCRRAHQRRARRRSASPDRRGARPSPAMRRGRLR
jgi:hypothetical protein